MDTATWIAWEEGRGWTAVVDAAVRVPTIPPAFWAGPAVVLCGALYAYTQRSWGLLAVAAVALVAIGYGLYRVGRSRRASQEFQDAGRLADRWAASVPMRLVWDNLRRAFVSLVWYRDVKETRQVQEDDGTGGLRTVEQVEEHREFPAASLGSRDPANEVRLLVSTTSGIVAASQVVAHGSDLADFVGLNGWHVEVSPHSVPGFIEIRLSRFAGGDMYGL
jgi:hypothetical protein